MTLGQKLAHARKHGVRRHTQIEVATHLNVTPQAVSGWERDEARPEVDKLTRLATFLGVSIEWLLSDIGPEIAREYMNQAAQNMRVERDRHPVIVPGEELVGDRDLPIYAATSGGNGHMIVTTDVIERVKRPAILEGVSGAYGILVVGDSMAKAYRQGDMALIHPHLQPLSDEVHVFYDHDPKTGEGESMIKNLLSYSDDKWRLEQFNPDRKFAVDRVDWPICHRVVGKYNRR